MREHNCYIDGCDRNRFESDFARANRAESRLSETTLELDSARRKIARLERLVDAYRALVLAQAQEEA